MAIQIHTLYINMPIPIYIYIYMYICKKLKMCIYIYIYIHVHSTIPTYGKGLQSHSGSTSSTVPQTRAESSRSHFALLLASKLRQGPWLWRMGFACSCPVGLLKPWTYLIPSRRQSDANLWPDSNQKTTLYHRQSYFSCRSMNNEDQGLYS